jgi:hypothetical protein
MNLRDLASSDFQNIIKDTERGGAVTAIIHFPEGNNISVQGHINDIDTLLEKKEGQIKERSVFFTCSFLSLPAMPQKGYTIDVPDITGKI